MPHLHLEHFLTANFKNMQDIILNGFLIILFLKLFVAKSWNIQKVKDTLDVNTIVTNTIDYITIYLLTKTGDAIFAREVLLEITLQKVIFVHSL